jgi:hypothetical protein
VIVESPGGRGRIRTCDPGVMSQTGPVSPVVADDRFVFKTGADADIDVR